MTAVTISLPGTPFQNLAAVNTIAALRLRSSIGLTQGENIQVNGGVALADGGGGLFTWDAASVLDDDGASVIKPADRLGSAAGRWRIAIGAGGAGGGGAKVATLDELKAAKVESSPVNLTAEGLEGIFYFTLADYTGQADDINIVEQDDTPLATGAWVRQRATSVSYDRTQSVAGKLDRLIYVSDARFAGGAKADGSDATAAIQAALTYAGTVAPAVVIANDGEQAYSTDEVNVPSDVEFRFNLKMRTPATASVERNCLRPNPRARLIGKIEGNNISNVEVVERGIFPAVENCHDVYLDVEITKTTVAVQAGLTTFTTPPRRWTGTIRAYDIAGFPGGSNGYGLNGYLHDSTLTIYTTNVPRHSLYLVAGASNNDIVLQDRGSRYAPVDIAAFANQPTCMNNRVVAYIRDHKADYPTLLSTGGFFFGKVSGNTLELHVSDSAPLDAGFRFLEISSTVYPTDNDVTIFFDGDIKGLAVVESNSSANNRVSVYGKGSNSSGGRSGVVYIGGDTVPTNPGTWALQIRAIDFTCTGGGFDHAVVVAKGYANTDLGNGAIKCRGINTPASPLIYMGGSNEYEGNTKGWVYQADDYKVTAPVAAGASVDVVWTYGVTLNQRYIPQFSVIQPSAGADNQPEATIVSISETALTVRIKNREISAASFRVSFSVHGY